MARRSNGGSGGGDAERRPPSRRRSGSGKKPSAKRRSASARTEAERREAAAKRAAKRKGSQKAPDEKAPEKKAPSGQSAKRAAKPRRTGTSSSSTSAREAAKTPARRATLIRPGELWGRRSVAIGVLLIALAIIGGLVLLIAGGGDNNNSKTSPQVKQLQEKFLKHTVVDVQKGISVRRPADWKDSKRDHVITLTSHNGCVVMTLAAPDAASKANSLHDDAIKLLKSSFGNAKVRPTPNGQEIGGLPTRSSTLAFKPKGGQVRVLLSVGKGDKYAYVTEVVARNPACQSDLELGNLILTSVQYTK